MTYRMFIDDERYPHNVTWATNQFDKKLYAEGVWVVVRNWNQVRDHISMFGMPEMISFDHDLGDDTPTGYYIAQKICDMVMDGEQTLSPNFSFRVHSKNPIGKENIEKYMKAFINYYFSK